MQGKLDSFSKLTCGEAFLPNGKVIIALMCPSRMWTRVKAVEPCCTTVAGSPH